MLRGNKGKAMVALSGAIVRSIKVSYEGEGMVAWESDSAREFLTGVIALSDELADLLLTDFKNSDMVSNRGNGVEGKLPSAETISIVVSRLSEWYEEQYKFAYLSKRVKHLRRLISHEIRVLNSQWKPKKGLQ